jgi:DNA end-binding protein Ku
MRGREYVVSLKPCGKGLVLETLRYADEVNKAASYFREIGNVEPDQDLLDLAETLIEKKTAPFDASEFHDRYVDALHELIERKMKAKGRKIKPEEEPAPARGANVIDLMAALKKSIERPGTQTSGARSSRGGKSASSGKPGGAKKAPARKTAASKPAAKPAPKKRAARG